MSSPASTITISKNSISSCPGTGRQPQPNSPHEAIVPLRSLLRCFSRGTHRQVTAERHPALAHAVMASTSHLLVLQQLDVQISLRRPRRAGDVAQPCGGEVERGLTVRERAHDTRAPPDLAQDALERVVG